MTEYKTYKIKKKRGRKTFTDKLTEEDIMDKLEDYIMVEDFTNIPLRTHIRYYTKINGKQKFRTGGFLLKKDTLPTYIVLGNGKITWSVQSNGTTFFRKMTLKEVKDEYEEIIEKLEKKISKLKNKLKDRYN